MLPYREVPNRGKGIHREPAASAAERNNDEARLDDGENRSNLD